MIHILRETKTFFQESPIKRNPSNNHISEDFTELLEPLVEQAKGYLRFQCVLPFQPFAVGPYTVTALKAFHRTNNPYIYLVSDGTKTMLYGNDTGMLPEETWDYLNKNEIHLDMVSLDCTMGTNEHTTSIDCKPLTIHRRM